MKKRFSLGIAAALLFTTLTPLGAPAHAASDIGKETLGSKDGWAAFSTGTTGGAAASSSNIFTVTNRQQLVDALGKSSNTTPKIIYVKGTINANVDDNNKPLGLNDYKDPKYDFDAYLKAYDPSTWGKKPPSGTLEQAREASQKNQASRVVIQIPSNTTIVGLGSNAVINGANFQLKKGTDNVIIRNIEFQDAYDYFPQWDPTDGSTGNWNSEYDNITISGATHVWIDHNSFNDGSHPDSQNGTFFGRDYQHHDGALDMVNQADLVTASYNHFSNHDKTTLIGNSDSKKADEGTLRVTMHHNYYENTIQRTPRVRYGQVHVYNNYYTGDVKRSEYPVLYVWGAGKSSKIFAENNVIDVAGLSASEIVAALGGKALSDTGTLLNGQAVNAGSSAGLSSSVGWKPSLYDKISPSASVKAEVTSQAGSGKL
ncbi:polysaccharide lyase family 1 protein [Paenibacillus farraposensis]|uniref:Polysaccharide lyase family 1 protein n=1 Tax=Paenibacillus farraposensis TaxID=2807095 RepID=A0ABW4DI92_9BACL|nr:pectate lyase [Paenibacillus farraposensis]MCC3378793.1 pectate lyase [Paenibacillus farraposensis]